MFIIHLSYDAGVSYSPDVQAKSLAELRQYMIEYDKMGLRWFVEDDGKRTEDVCSIHKCIINTLKDG
jgi:hypothetical protein